MGETSSLLGRIVTWTVVGLLAVIAFKIAVRLIGFAIGLFGIVFGIAMFALFTLGPLVLLGWLAMKAWAAFTNGEQTI